MQDDFLIALTLTENVGTSGDKGSTRQQQWRGQVFVHSKKQKQNNNNLVT